ncbi:MAG: glutamate mutase L, partial [Candidatus Bathyarchaeota archaeon]
MENIVNILATDCGSTTSKARFFQKLGDEYRFVASGEAPTTVEAPFEDVTLGVRNAIREVEELTGHKLLSTDGIITPTKGKEEGVDLYVTTSSAGGGLQMMVAGVVKSMTAESAERAALGAGAIVMDVIAVDDGRHSYEKIQRIRYLRPDMILLAGGTDGGTIVHVVETAELIEAAKPKPRLGVFYKLPIVYAGNIEAREPVSNLFDKTYALKIVDNIRPTLESENTEPARNVIHELFMEHVMSHAPGYSKLMLWTPIPIMPTPAGEGRMFQAISKTRKINLIGVGLGGATTNVYSIYEGKFVRTVSANLGMSYSICNVLKEAETENITRWLPFEIDEKELRNRLYNKMIRPTTIPQSVEDLIIEHAVAREALRLGFQHHKLLARPLRGIQRKRTVADIFEQEMFEETYIDMMNVGLVAGTGGLLSHAPRRAQAAMMLMDGFQPEGVTRLAQDSVFMMPHLGVLSTVHPKAAIEIFEKDCLVKMG